MAYFINITIVKCNYFYGFSTTPFIGHVGTTGIFLLWENYEHEFRDYSDVKHEKTNISDSYDATGYDECWAGSVENLFDRSQALKSE